ncbi:MAG: PduL/EutD family phosphate acyltransferase [Christensenellales bacterium]|jgi:putative phosphotransacetylase
MQVLVEVSARHVHLSPRDFAALFGADAQLTFRKVLSQPGEFLAHERVDVVGVKRTIERVAILGPLRARSQVEMAITDLRTLGINAPIRDSGDIDGSSPITLVGPMGKIELPCGLIAAKRHIHMTPADAARAGVIDRQIVSVRVDGARPLVFGDVTVRVRDTFALALHIDTDEGNAAGITAPDCYGEILTGGIP